MTRDAEAQALTPNQQTLAQSFELSGHGLHSGAAASASVRPADPDTGIVFRRLDLPGEPVIPARASLVSGVEWETVIGSGDAVVRTVEHLLAAVSAHRLDNLEIRLDGPEPPALDGSASHWCDAIRAAGVESQDREARILRLTEPLAITEGGSRYVVAPAEEYRVSARIEFDHPAIGHQYASERVAAEEFCTRVAPARTFGIESWGPALRERGLAGGSSPDNTVIIPDDATHADLDLRFTDEFVRHKILDIVGDLALVGARIEASVFSECPSHRGNVALARTLERRLSRPADGSPVLDIDAITKYLPHRYPFLLVDRVIEFEPNRRILAIKNVTINEPFFVGHFPGHAIMPGVLIVEAMAQAGGLLLMNDLEHPESTVVYFMALDDVRFRRPVHPGDQLEFDVELVQFRRRVFRMRGVARVDGQVVAEGLMMAQLVDR